MRKVFTLMVLNGLMVWSVAARAQESSKPSLTGKQGQQAPQGQAAAPRPSPEEVKGFLAVQNELDPDKQLQLAADFEKNFPKSTLLANIYTFEWDAYQKKGELDKAVEAAEKGVKLDANNPAALVEAATLLPQPGSLQHASELEKEKKLSEAEEYATRAIKLVVDLPKPTQMTDDQLKKFKGKVSSDAHSSLGMVHLQRSMMALGGKGDPEELKKAEDEFKQAVSVTDSPEATDYYRLGEVYKLQQKLDDAIAAFGRASELGQGTGIDQYASRQIDAIKKVQAQQPKAPPKP